MAIPQTQEDILGALSGWSRVRRVRVSDLVYRGGVPYLVLTVDTFPGESERLFLPLMTQEQWEASVPGSNGDDPWEDASCL